MKPSPASIQLVRELRKARYVMALDPETVMAEAVDAHPAIVELVDLLQEIEGYADSGFDVPLRLLDEARRVVRQWKAQK